MDVQSKCNNAIRFTNAARTTLLSVTAAVMCALHCRAAASSAPLRSDDPNAFDSNDYNSLVPATIEHGGAVVSSGAMARGRRVLLHGSLSEALWATAASALAMVLAYAMLQCFREIVEGNRSPRARTLADLYVEACDLNMRKTPPQRRRRASQPLEFQQELLRVYKADQQRKPPAKGGQTHDGGYQQESQEPCYENVKSTEGPQQDSSDTYITTTEVCQRPGGGHGEVVGTEGHGEDTYEQPDGSSSAQGESKKRRRRHTGEGTRSKGERRKHKRHEGSSGSREGKHRHRHGHRHRRGSEALEKGSSTTAGDRDDDRRKHRPPAPLPWQEDNSPGGAVQTVAKAPGRNEVYINVEEHQPQQITQQRKPAKRASETSQTSKGSSVEQCLTPLTTLPYSDHEYLVVLPGTEPARSKTADPPAVPPRPETKRCSGCCSCCGSIGRWLRQKAIKVLAAGFVLSFGLNYAGIGLLMLLQQQPLAGASVVCAAGILCILFFSALIIELKRARRAPGSITSQSDMARSRF